VVAEVLVGRTDLSALAVESPRLLPAWPHSVLPVLSVRWSEFAVEVFLALELFSRLDVPNPVDGVP
jgi:hypothetical protein